MLIGIDPITILIIGGGFAFLTLMFGLVVSIRSEKTEVDQRLDRYLTAGHIIDQSNAEKSAALTDWFNKRVEKSSYGDQIYKMLARADLKLKSGEYRLYPRKVDPRAGNLGTFPTHAARARRAILQATE